MRMSNIIHSIWLNVDFTGVVSTVWVGSVLFGKKEKRKKRVVVVTEDEF